MSGDWWGIATFVVGAVLVLVTYLDALATTLVVGAGAGPLTRRLTAWLWALTLRADGRGGGSRVLAVGGGAMLLGTVLVWVALLWTGWTLVFLAGDPAVQRASSGVAADSWDVAYFAGFTLFTLGVGDYEATTSGWRILTAAASFSGLFLITLAITYLINVVTAVVGRRALAVRVRGLGTNAAEIVEGGWDGSRFSSTYTQQLVSLGGQVATIAEQHLAYPVLHTFHSPLPDTAAPLALAELDDAVQLLTLGVAPSSRPDPSATRALHHSLTRYLTTAGATAPGRRGQDPPPLDLDRLRRAGIPVVCEEEFQQRLDHGRRQAMTRLVTASGWSWPPPDGAGR